MYYTNSLYEAGGSITALELNGKTHVAGLYVTHPLLRRAADSLTLKVAFEYKDISDYILGGLNSRDRIRTLNPELSYDGVDRMGGDVGWVTGLGAIVGGTEASDADLTSLGTGLRLYWGNVSARLDWAVPQSGGWMIKNAQTWLQVMVSF